jgi:branched-subunit amino acid permease
MILNNIKDGFIGNKEISRIYLGNNLIFPALSGFWQFTEINSTITGFSVTTVPSGTIDIDWGDENVNTINSGQTINKTYTI